MRVAFQGFSKPSSAGGGGADPDSISGLTIWLKADAITGKSDEDTLTNWVDSSGNNNHATCTTCPIYDTNQINSLPAVRFNGSSQFLTLVDLSALTAGHVFVVVKIDTDPPLTDATTGLWTLGNAGDTTHFPYLDGTIYDQAFSTVRKTVANPTPALTSWRVYEVRSGAGDWEAYLDGTSLFSTGTNTFVCYAAPTLGADTAPTPDNFMDGMIAEFILYNKKLNGTEQTTVKTYLAAKYGLTLA